MKLSKFLNWKVILAVLVVFIIVFFSSIINFFVDLQWYSEVGYLGVFYTRLFTQFKLGIPIFLVLFLLIFVYLLFLKKEYVKLAKVIYTKVQLKSVNIKLIIVSVILSILISAGIASSSWSDILKFIEGTSFNLADPLFSKDISFYIFSMPIYKLLYNFIFTIIVLFTIFTLLFYVLMAVANKELSEDMGYNVLSMDRGKRSALWKDIVDFTGRRMAFPVGAIFIMIGIGFIFKNYDLVYSPRGVAFGASYTDVNVTIVFNKILLVLSILAAASVFYALFKKKAKLTLWVIGLMIGASLIQGVVELGVDKLVVQPNEIDKERPYLEYNIKYTQSAYGLDKVEEKDFPAEQNLTSADIKKNEATINNIRVNDFGPALDVYNQLQGIRYYYKFNDIDIDRYNIDGKYTQVFLAAREMDQSKLSGSQTWQNLHMVFTHGYGITMSPVNSVTEQGQPNMIIKDIPPVSAVDIKVDRPQIYFGEMTDDYIITNTKNVKEMDYPSGDANKQTVYEGKAGINLGGLNRILFMVNRGSFNFLLSQDITPDSKIVINRNITERVKKIAPFLEYDKDPYIVLNDGKLYWIMDAYTTSSAYPYSEPIDGINYIRNSVKVVIDAYDGTTDFYLIDENDPLAVTYGKIFPGLFKKFSEMPKGLVAHLRYPEDIFNIQLEAYKKYHMSDPRVFYNKEDLWSIAGESQSAEQTSSKISPSYIVMKLPEGSDEEFMLMSPYTPSGKDNMVAWLAARMDDGNYGKLIVYKFPKQKVTYGPTQFKARINQDTTISKERSLWNQQGSSIIDGGIITIPIEKSLLYVMPIYIKSSGQNSIPEMKRVVLGYGDNIVMDVTLDKALNTMFNLSQPDNKPPAVDLNKPAEGVETGVQDLIIKANDEFLKAKDSQQKGDWTEYGKHLNELENILKQLGLSAK